MADLAEFGLRGGWGNAAEATAITCQSTSRKLLAA